MRMRFVARLQGGLSTEELCRAPRYASREALSVMTLIPKRAYLANFFTKCSLLSPREEGVAEANGQA